jgi:glutamate-1-semialdehyde 2,1-aminomutase
MRELVHEDAVPGTGSLLGGISSQFRINPFTGKHITVRRAHGATLETVDGQTYLDMFMAHGSTVVGHAHPAVIEAVRASLDDGVVIGYETGLGEVVAKRLSDILPSAEAVRFAPSGSDAVAASLRLARAHTRREIVVKIDGHFNGGSDYAMVNSLTANTDATNPGGRPSRPILSSGGIPHVVAETVVPVPWNDLPALESALAQYSERVACVIMVPIDFNNGCLTTNTTYLEAARDLAHSSGALFILDEVLTGFKTGIGGAEALYGVTPDVSLWSKALSSGVPLSAICGNSEVMATFMEPLPDGAIQGGTFAGNIMGLAAANATLDLLEAPGFYPDLLNRAARFVEDLQAMFDRSPVPARVQSAGCMFTVYVGTREPVQSYADIRALDRSLATRYFTRCIDAGVYFHTDFSISSAHSDEILDLVLERMEGAARQAL